MQCINCGHGETAVLETRKLEDERLRRRRQCAKCGARFSTVEGPVSFARGIPQPIPTFHDKKAPPHESD